MKFPWVGGVYTYQMSIRKWKIAKPPDVIISIVEKCSGHLERKGSHLDISGRIHEGCNISSRFTRSWDFTTSERVRNILSLFRKRHVSTTLVPLARAAVMWLHLNPKQLCQSLILHADERFIYHRGGNFPLWWYYLSVIHKNYSEILCRKRLGKYGEMRSKESREKNKKGTVQRQR